MIKVLHLFDKYLNSTMNWAAALLHHTEGIEHHVAAPWIVQNEFFHPEFHYHYGALQSLYGKKVQSEWDGGKWERIARGIEHKSGWWLNRLKNLDIDIIHAHFGPVGCQALPLAKKMGKPLVVSFYGYDYEKTLIVHPNMIPIYKAMFEAATMCIALGPNTAQMLMQYGCADEKIHFLPPAVFTNEIKFVPNKQRSQTLQIAQVSSFTEKKGIKDTLIAFAKAVELRPKMYLTLIGETIDSTYHTEVLDLIQKLQLQTKVAILGFKQNAEVRKKLQSFDIFIHPSHRSKSGDNEGLPVSILEALATGLPVISTNHADIPSAVRNQKNGFLRQPRDIDGLCSALLKIADLDDLEFEHLRLSARRTIELDFDIPKRAMELGDIYSGILSRPNE